MARRRRKSNAEAVTEVIALLPWWGCLMLAVASWVMFHFVATRPVATPDASGRLGTDFFLGVWFRGISIALQYAAPMVCIFAAIMSYVQRKKRAALLAEATGSTSADALNGISWREFELLVGEAFRVQGYQVKEQGGAQADGGVDLVLRKGSEVFLVQCKQWKAFKVGVDVVRELYGVMAARGAAGGFVVTSGRFTEDAVAFASGRNVRLVDGTKLFGLLRQARSSLSAAPAVVAASDQGSASTTPLCPKCNAAMVRRTARKGANGGTQFWGCSRFPACHGTRA
jgi:restriction system protein